MNNTNHTKDQKTAEVSNPLECLVIPDDGYSIIYADPPWKTQTFKERKDGLLSRKLPYQQMTDEEIKHMKVSNISSENSILFMWCIDSRIPNAAEIMKAWGFTYKCVGFVWAKKAKTTNGFNGGFSSYTKRDCEFCLIGTKGKYLSPKRGINQILIEPKTSRSKKPGTIRQRIVEMMGNVPRIELFAREKTPGWDSIGNEINGMDINEELKLLVYGRMGQ